MLKKIHVSDVQLGMFIHELGGSWMEHPFWQTQFLLSSPKDLDRLRSSVVREVWIDVAKGLDVAGGSEEAEVEAQTEAILLSAVEPPPVQLVSFEEEVERARAICARSKEAVIEMFSDVRMGRAIEAEQARSMVEEIMQSVARQPEALISIARLKDVDEYTYMHSVATCGLMIALGRQLNFDDEALREAGMAGLLHDVGKAGIPDAVLNKVGRLTDEEWQIMCGHPEVGARYLSGANQASDRVIDVCLHHHEKTDGSGYPHGLKDDDISLLAAMGAVCDVYDAITSDRAYRKGWNPAEAVRKMAEWSKGHFKEPVFRSFVKAVGIYPSGSLVRLESGRLGVVTEQNPQSLLLPKVKVFYSARTSARITPRSVDLSTLNGSDKIVSREEPEKWGFLDLDTI
jgi:putative nucleotidyltransferase with HDIG domain